MDSREAKDQAIAQAVVDRFEPEQVPFLAALVEQPSCSREPDDVEAAARLLDARAEGLGLSVDRRRVPGGTHAAHRLYGSPGLAADAPTLTLVGHIDTVFARSAGFFGFRREGDTAFGPGVLDMKSGLSSMFLALEALRVADPSFAPRLRILINTDEEVGSPTSDGLIAEVAQVTREALVFEAGRAEDRLVVARKGVGSYRLTATGRSAHAGLHHAEGVNAIEALAHAIVRVEAVSEVARGMTANVGLVEGGTSSNTVPDEAHCTIDCRFESPEDGEELSRKLEGAVAMPLPPHLSSASLALRGRLHRPPMRATPESRELAARYGACARAAGLGAGEAPLQGGGSDANLFSAAGVPSIDGLGPAGAGIHRTSERCNLTSLQRRTVALACFLSRAAV
ncbi:MAG: M20/M25/M40 family metallo-hydrolase [Sandaracinaceae bacterium]